MTTSGGQDHTILPHCGGPLQKGALGERDLSDDNLITVSDINTTTSLSRAGEVGDSSQDDKSGDGQDKETGAERSDRADLASLEDTKGEIRRHCRTRKAKQVDTQRRQHLKEPHQLIQEQPEA
mmetsp:Transcript_44961/g.137322  ORF Transcript_44961/g.137322 Transcript_44961/m.137322 type:complete len:123 (+) Transcript_44961:3593-3961(+)